MGDYVVGANGRVATKAVDRRDAILQAVSFAASGFLRCEDWKENTDQLLGHLGQATAVDRIYLFENGRDRDGNLVSSQRFEWVATGVVPQIGNPELQDMPFEASGFGRWAQVLAAGEPIVGRTFEMPCAEQAFLESQEILSILVVPVFAAEKWWGFMGFDDCVHARVWTAGEVEALRTAAGAIGAAIHRQRTEEALRRSEDQLRQSQKMEAIGQLAGGVAHDFNNLLTVMMAHTDLMLKALHEHDPMRVHAIGVQKAINSATALTHQLLTFSRRQFVQPITIAFNAVVEAILPMLRRLIGENIEVITDLHPKAGNVLADPGQMEQVMLNLAVNARDAMPDGGVLTIATEKVEIGQGGIARQLPHQPGHYVRLSVRDTGIGMDTETLRRIFEPFFTTKEPGRGTGLGLSTVYGIVKHSDGWIFCDSRPGRGAQFRIYLPVVESLAQKTPAPGSCSPSELQATGTILLVEDDTSLRHLARDVLVSSGFRVLEAASGPGALEISMNFKEHIDLVLSDIVLPGMSGHCLVEYLREARPGLRAILTSGYVDKETNLRGQASHPNAFLAKPFTPPQLLEAVRKTLTE